MRNFLIFINIIILFAGTSKSQWLQNFNGPGNGDDAGNCIALDDQDNIFVGGHVTSRNGDADIAVVKYTSGGIFQWNFIYNGSGNSEDRPYGIIVDQLNNIFITGYSDNDFCTIKLNPQGNPVWVKKYNGPGNGEDRAYGIIVDNFNYVIVSGWSYGGSSDDFNIYTIKYDQSGNTQWFNSFNGTGSGEDRSYGIIVDQLNNIIITGTTYSSSASSAPSASLDYITMKLSTGGNLVWEKIYNGTGGGEDRSYGIVTDQANNIYVTGASTGSGSGFDYVTIGYYSNGNLKFNKRKNGTGNGEDIARSIAYTTNNQVIVTGSSFTGPDPVNEDVMTINYNNDGSENWSMVYNGQLNNSDAAYKVVNPQNSSSYVAVIGYTTNQAGKDILILSYNSSGTQSSVHTINGSGNKEDIGYNGVSISNGIVITGFTTNLNNNTDFVTSKFTNSQLNEIIKVSEIIPASFKLYQNYPNPFNPVTRIKFDIPTDLNSSESGIHVSLKIYNSLGEEAGVLINSLMKPGSYEVFFNAEKLTSGVYFYTLNANNIIQTNKLLLIK